MRNISSYFSKFHYSKPKIQPLTRLWAVLLALLGFGHAAVGQSFLRADGPRIVNASNQEVILNGMNLGNWAVQEGYMIKLGWPGIDGKQTQGMVKKALYNAGMSDAAVESFYQSYRNNFITKPDIDYIASKGFNCVRLPLHYELFLTPAQRALRNSVMRGTLSYDSYVGALTDWYNANQLFTDPANMEAVRMIDNTLAWAQANNMYVILDLHAVPGSQGTDANIADQIKPLDLWNRAINQDVLNRLWAFIAARYKNDARVAMYDLINEPNNVPSNPQIHDVLQRLINTVRAQGDNHLLLLEGNGWGNDYNYLEPFTFTNTANLVYNSHRYSGTGYLLDNNINSTEGGVNSLRFIGNLRNFRTRHNVPIWIGETGENSDVWMNEAARSLNSVGIGWCHWTYKRFEDRSNPAFMHINPPYVVDGPSSLNQVLTNIQFANCVPNSTVNAISPSILGLVNYPGGGSYNGNVTPPPPPPVTGVTNLSGVYGIQNRNSGLWMDVSAISTANGAKLLQWTGTGGDNQHFTFTHLGGGTYKIVAVHSGKAFDIAGVSTADGAVLNQWDYVGGDNQQFVVQDAGNGYVRLVAKHSGKVLEVGNSATNAGAEVRQWTNNNSATQQWRLERWGGTPPPPPSFSRLLEAESASLNNGMVAEGCSEGGQDMGYVNDGDYLVFNGINFPTSGSYLVEYRVASGSGGGTVSCDLNGGSIQLGTTTVPGTGGWQTWRTVSRTVNVNAGTYNFGIYATVGGWNINWIRITKTGGRSALAGASTSLEAHGVALHPNPAESQITLTDASAFVGGQVRIQDMTGREVWHGTYQGRSVPVSSLKAGLYLLELSNAGKTSRLRFVKQ